MVGAVKGLQAQEESGEEDGVHDEKVEYFRNEEAVDSED